MDFTIFVEVCGVCKECCRSIPVCVCDYRMIEAIKSDILPIEIIKKLRIYQIEEEMVDYIAKAWWYYPDQNLLKLMTIVEEGFYHFLTIPQLREGCPFLSENGCRVPKLKPYNCAIYPYYLERGVLKVSSTCKYSKIRDLEEIRPILKQIAGSFARECAKYQQNYFIHLKTIQEKFSIPQFTYRV